MKREYKTQNEIFSLNSTIESTKKIFLLQLYLYQYAK